MKKNRRVQAFILTSFVLLIPSLALAVGEEQLTQSFGSIKTIIDTFTSGILSSLGTLFATAALVAFFYGIVQYIWGVRDGKPEKVKDGNNFMLWGLIALFIMFSVWGIIIFFQKIFFQGIDTSKITIPRIELGGRPASPTRDTGLPNSPTSPAGECAGMTEVQRDACLARQQSPAQPNCAGIASEMQRDACLAEQAARAPCGPNETRGADGSCVWVNGF